MDDQPTISSELVTIQTLPSGDAARPRRTIGLDFGGTARSVAATSDGRTEVLRAGQGPKGARALLSIVPDDATSAQDAASCSLRAIRRFAEGQLGGPVEGAVIAVPAHFGDARREAVQRAAQNARIPVIQLVTEPVAAAVAFGRRRRFEGRVAVVDVGASSFGVTLLDLRAGGFEVIAAGQEPFLGGASLDQAIARHLTEELARSGGRAIDLDPDQALQLERVAEEVKVGLSVQQSYSVRVPGATTAAGAPVELRLVVTRAVAEALAAPLLERMVEATRGVLERGGVRPDEIEALLFIGGATRWPPLHERLELFFRRRGIRRASPSELVALGAAVLAAELGAGELPGVLPASIGFVGRGGRYVRLVPRGTKIPVERAFVVDGSELRRGRYELPLFRGESVDAGENEFMGHLVIEGSPRSDVPSYELTLKLDAHGVVTAEAVELPSRAPLLIAFDPAREADLRGRERTGTHERAARATAEPGSPLSLLDRMRALFGVAP
jgi:molecular chaperone DnaK